jgi:small subunit ribosomal protein S3
MQLEKRIAVPTRHAQSRWIRAPIRAKGIKVRVSGRLNGAEIARSEWYLQGRLPLHTCARISITDLRRPTTTYGVIGIKCWIYKGEILPNRGPQGPAAARV